MKVIIVDDEPLAQDVLENYIQKISSLELIGKCNNAMEAFSMLGRKQVDLMLLDINMPEITGTDFLRNIKNPPLVIFTTAYSEYALESYELDAVDYLLKPVSFERFLKAIDKAAKMGSKYPNAEEGPEAFNPDDAVMFVRSEGKLVKIDLSRVLYIEGLKDYIRFCTLDGKVIVHSTMKNLEEQLKDKPEFLRVQKSYIVNIRHISEVWGNIIKIGENSLTVGTTYREGVFQFLERHKLI